MCQQRTHQLLYNIFTHFNMALQNSYATITSGNMSNIGNEEIQVLLTTTNISVKEKYKWLRGINTLEERRNISIHLSIIKINSELQVDVF